MKTISLRMPDQMAAELGCRRPRRGVAVSEVLRAAIEDYVTRRYADQAFQERLRKPLEGDREVLERLSED